MSRWVLHVDMDAFYAAVEVQEDPALKGRPVIVGGTGKRGVVASASYEARGFGARSAMPAGQARRLCPHAVFLPPNFPLYHRYSEHLHRIFRSYTGLVEGIALDEAFLDVTGCGTLFGPPGDMAAQIRERVAGELGLTCSIGAGPNKLIAKLASESAKPRAGSPGTGPVPGPGIVVVKAEEVLGFLWPLPVGALWGVGPASNERLRRLGVFTVGDLAALPELAVAAALGKANGQSLHALAWGRDERAVVPDRAPKSIGHEETYPQDLTERAELERRLVAMCDSVAQGVRAHGMVARTVVLKLRYGDFTTITRSHSFPSPQSTGPAFWKAAQALLDKLDLRNGARLLGVSASGLVPGEAAPSEQLQLELSPLEGRRYDRAGTASADWGPASRAVDAVRARFGDSAVVPATAVERPAGPRSA
ncbi:MAG TPA: DNA polymerase IV [Acidimicrobiales bacterium]|nr:DNA polymerase IV [Acidimicrobiales bacterium]